MNPEDIKKHFGEDALNMLYDCLLENPVHELADWILALHTEQQIGQWIATLREEQNENE